MAPPDSMLVKSPYEIMPTPVDDRGLVDLALLIDGVNTYVPDGYKWRGKPDGHHMYWSRADYENMTLFSPNNALKLDFRELAIHKADLPREFHDFLHRVTEPVKPPDEDVMQYRIDGWNVAVSLFNSVNILHRRLFLSNEEAARASVRRTLYTKFQEISDMYELAQEIPDEFLPVDLEPVRKLVGAKKPQWTKGRDFKDADRAFRPIATTIRAGRVALDEAFKAKRAA